MATFDYGNFETIVAQSLNCTIRQVAVVTFSPTLVDGLILVDFVVFQRLATGSTDLPANDLANAFLTGYGVLEPLRTNYRVTSAVYEPSLEIPAHALEDGSGEFDAGLPRRLGATGFIGMLVVVGLMVLASIAFVIYYLVRGRYDTSLVANEAQLGAPTTNLSVWIMGQCAGVSDLATKGKITDLPPHASAAAAGAGHLLVVANGILFVIGENSNGQLGLGHRNPVSTLTPNLFFKDLSIAKVLCGDQHSAVITSDGELFTFGAGTEGCLGHGNYEDCLLPTKVNFFNGNRVIGIATGTHHMLVLAEDGLYALGWNGHGQLMLGHNDSVCSPAKVEFFNGYEHSIRAIACGVTHSLVLCGDWEVYACGGNEFGQLGLGHWEDVWEPELMTLADTTSYVHSISCWYHTLIACDDGLYACGEGDGFKHGLGRDDCAESVEWVADLGEYDIRFVFAGNEHSFFVSSNYELFIVGRSTAGKLGRPGKEFPQITMLDLATVVDTRCCETTPEGWVMLSAIVLGPTFSLVLMTNTTIADDSTADGTTPTSSENEPIASTPKKGNQNVAPTARDWEEVNKSKKDKSKKKKSKGWT